MGKTVRVLPRLIVAFAAVLLLIVALGGIALLGAGRLVQQTELLYRHPFAVSNAVRAARSDIVSLQRWENRLLTVGTSPDAEPILAEISADKRDLAIHLATIRSRYLGPREDLARLDTALNEAERQREALEAHVRTGTYDPVKAEAIAESVHTSHRKVEQAILTIREFAQQKAEEFRREAERQGRLVTATIFTAAGIAILLAATIVFLIVRQITSPLERLREAMLRIARGDLTVEIPHAGDRSDIGEVARALVHLRDSAVELDRSNQALGAFAHITSHDLREPLRNISIYMDLTERRLGHSMDRETRELFSLAVAAAQRVNRMILDLLAFSRVDRRMHPPEPTDSARVVEAVLRAMKARIAKSGGRIAAAERLPVVMAREETLLEVFRHLLDNGLSFAREGKAPEIEIDAEQDGSFWRFIVRDKGIGLPADPVQRERIFKLFQRLHQKEDFGGGSGIGLAVCRKIVEGYGGSISLDSPGEGLGTTVSFTLPAVPEGSESFKPSPPGPSWN